MLSGVRKEMTLIVEQSAVRNRLVESMSAADFDLIATDIRPVQLKMAQVVEEAGMPVADIVFLTSGLASRIVVGNGDAQTEGGHIGREGMTGRSVVLESPTASERIEMQVAGAGVAIPAGRLLELVALIYDDGYELVIHAMKARSQYLDEI